MFFASDRHFQLWDYSVGHQQFLMRSPPVTGRHGTNIDIVMLGVEYLEIPTSLDGVATVAPSQDEIKRAVAALGKPLGPSDTVYGFESGGRRFLAVAAACRIWENTLGLFESSLEYFLESELDRSLGKLLYRS